MNRVLRRLYVFFLSFIPGRVGILLRARYYKPFIGNSALIRYGVVITHPENLKVGKMVSIGIDSFIRSAYGVTIGDYTMISWRVNILAQNHRHILNGIPYRFQGYTGAPIRIGSNCWIGCNVSILPGVTIGDNCVIGASSVITKDIPDDCIVVGVNRVVKKMEKVPFDPLCEPGVWCHYMDFPCNWFGCERK